MNESEFWLRLEFRLVSEFAGLTERKHQHIWCDGFLPHNYIFDGPSPQITGDCWIYESNSPQCQWKFRLLLPRAFGSRDEIDWSLLLPAEKLTRWMSFDETKAYLEIEPAVAVPDLA